jgi:hypothetical protein
MQRNERWVDGCLFDKKQAFMIRKFLKSNIWIIEGLVFGIIMFIFMTFIYPFLISGEPITWMSIVLGIPIYLFGGLLFGFITKYIKKGEKQK